MEQGDKATRVDAGHGRPPRKFGILAGWGRYPFIIAESLRRQGVEVYCLGVSGHAEPGLEKVCDHFEWIGLCKIGRAIRHFKRHGVTDVTMIGKIHKVVLYQPWRWFKHLPDLTTIRIFFPHFFTRRKDCRDDTLLNAVIDAFAAEGIHFGVATDYAPGLLAREGQLTERGPSTAQWRDIEFGWEMAKRMGGLDVGQSVCVKDQAVMAVEAVEGTDLCIQRAGTLCRAGGFTVVKVAKPRQDMRFDVPTVGIRTLRTMLDAGAKVLAIEAGRTILLEQPDAIEFANQNKLVLVSLVRPDIMLGRQNEVTSSESPDCPQCPATLPHHFPVPETRR